MRNYDLWLQNGTVDALTEAERADLEHALGDCVNCGEPRAHPVHQAKPTRYVMGDEHDYVVPQPDGPCEICGGVIRCDCDFLYDSWRDQQMEDRYR